MVISARSSASSRHGALQGMSSLPADSENRPLMSFLPGTVLSTRMAASWLIISVLVSEEQLVISEIDVERLRAERRINTTFAASKGTVPSDKKPLRITTEFVNSKELNLTRTFDMHRLSRREKPLNERCEEVFSIQVAGLAQLPGSHRSQDCCDR